MTPYREVPTSATIEASTQAYTGIVKKWSPRGFGFITPDKPVAMNAPKDGVFVHASDIASRDEKRNLSEGARVAFDVEVGDRGPHAVRVVVLAP